MARIDLERSSDTLAKAETIAREVKPNDTNHVRRFQARDGDGRGVCREARHWLPSLYSSCMQYRTFIISGNCSYRSQICASSSTSCVFTFAQSVHRDKAECTRVSRHGRLTMPCIHTRAILETTTLGVWSIVLQSAGAPHIHGQIISPRLKPCTPR
jgi:hypothetical protein